MTTIDPSMPLLPDPMAQSDSAAPFPGAAARDVAGDAGRFARYLERRAEVPGRGAEGRLGVGPGLGQAPESAAGDALQNALASLRPRRFSADEHADAMPSRPVMPSLVNADPAGAGPPQDAKEGDNATMDSASDNAPLAALPTFMAASQPGRPGERRAPPDLRADAGAFNNATGMPESTAPTAQASTAARAATPLPTVTTRLGASHKDGVVPAGEKQTLQMQRATGGTAGMDATTESKSDPTGIALAGNAASQRTSGAAGEAAATGATFASAPDSIALSRANLSSPHLANAVHTNPDAASAGPIQGELTLPAAAQARAPLQPEGESSKPRQVASGTHSTLAVAEGPDTAPPKSAPASHAAKTSTSEAATLDMPEDNTGSMPTDHAEPHGQAGPLLTPAQLQARNLKRKAIGLDGGLKGMHNKLAPAHTPRRVESSDDKNLAVEAAAASAASAQQPIRWAQPVASAPVTKVGPIATARLPGSQAGPQASTFEVVDGKANTASMPVAFAAPLASTPMAVAPLATKPVASTAPTATAEQRVPVAFTPTDGTREPVMAAAEHQAQKADIPLPETIDATTGLPTNIPGAPPEPVRLKKQQRVAEVIGAQIQAQEAHLAVVNTPESLPLEILKAL